MSATDIAGKSCHQSAAVITATVQRHRRPGGGVAFSLRPDSHHAAVHAASSGLCPASINENSVWHSKQTLLVYSTNSSAWLTPFWSMQHVFVLGCSCERAHLHCTPATSVEAIDRSRVGLYIVTVNTVNRQYFTH